MPPLVVRFRSSHLPSNPKDGFFVMGNCFKLPKFLPQGYVLDACMRDG